MDLEVTSGVMATLLAESAGAAPEECCGLLLGQGGRITEARAADNVAADRLRRFEIDPKALLVAHKAARAGGPQLLGYYHSHPEGHPVPSATDCDHASGDASVWAIVAGGRVAFWRDGESGFEAIEVPTVDQASHGQSTRMVDGEAKAE
jgi:proteasome lid subunit RPN8/RPN11